MTSTQANLLIVDDEPAMTTLCRRILSQAGYVVHLAHSADEARACYQECDGDIDLLLCDLQMPDEDGIALATSLLDDNPDLRILFMTGYCTDQLSQKLNGTKPDPVTVLGKPFAVDMLLNYVERALQADT